MPKPTAPISDEDLINAVSVPDIQAGIVGCLLQDPSLLATCDLAADELTGAPRAVFEILRRLGPDADVVLVGEHAKREIADLPMGRLIEFMEATHSPKFLPRYIAQLRRLQGIGTTCGSRPVVLVPGQHVIRGDNICVGTDHFAARVLHYLPEGLLYRRGLDVGIITGPAGARRFEPLTPQAARRLIDSAVALFQGRPDQESHDELVPADSGALRTATSDVLTFVACSVDQASLLIDAARSSDKCRILDGIVRFPVYRTDWTLSPPGFDRGIFYDPPPELADLAPADDYDLLLDLLVDFPFKDEASRFNMIGLLLTPFLRFAVENVPYHLIHSPMERTGKTKLVDILGLVVSGSPVPAMQISQKEEETEKRITAAMMAGKPIIFFDNLREFLDSASLAALVTGQVWEGRPLGTSVLGEFKNRATVVMTGNNVRATGELVKRTVPICLEPKTARPEERTDFVHPDLTAYVLAHRPRIIAALLGLVENWKAAGSPPGAKRLGGFEKWMQAMSGVLAGTPWFENAHEWRKNADPDQEDLEAFVQEWWLRFEGRPQAAATLAQTAKEGGWFPRVVDRATERSLATTFALRVLRTALDRPVLGYLVRRSGTGSASYWYLQRL
jgi:hypothetical protein